tara:strand:- start:64 stop:450 length:387 start_codon:yes stop_codon:yes gene_type:complete
MKIKTRRYKVTTEKMFNNFFKPNQPLSGFKKVFDLSLVPTTTTVKELWNREDTDDIPLPFDYDQAHPRLGAPDDWYWLPHKTKSDLWVLISSPLVYKMPFWAVTEVRAFTKEEALEERVKELEALLGQ